MKLRILSSIALLLSLSSASAEERLTVVTENWPPFIIQGEPVTGIVTEKVKTILDSTEIPYSLAVYPWARSYYLATTKPNTLIYSIYRTTEREPNFHWFCPIHPATTIHAFKLKTNDIAIDTIDDLRQTRIGIMRGDNSHGYLLKKGFEENVNLDIAASEDANIRKLITGKVDVIIQSKPSLTYRLREMNAAFIEVEAGYRLHTKGSSFHCMALSKNSSPKIVEKVTAAFDSWQKSR